MKKLAIVCMVMCMSSILNAQTIDLRQKTKGFELQINPAIVSEDVGQSIFRPLSLEMDIMGGYRFNPYVRVAAGFGFNMTSTTSRIEFSGPVPPDVLTQLIGPFISMPLFVNVKANMTKSIVSPYVSVDCGYNFTLPVSGNNHLVFKQGFMIRPSLGVDFHFRMCTMFVGVGYSFQTCSFADLPYKNYSQITQTIGFQF